MMSIAYPEVTVSARSFARRQRPTQITAVSEWEQLSRRALLGYGAIMSTPICCSLEAGEYRDRVAWIAALNQDALFSDAREGRRLELVYAPEAAERVAEMVRRERACCPFLVFDLRKGKGQTKLVITAPPEAEDSEALFA